VLRSKQSRLGLKTGRPIGDSVIPGRHHRHSHQIFELCVALQVADSGAGISCVTHNHARPLDCALELIVFYRRL
jgi:hypothetical protein